MMIFRQMTAIVLLMLFVVSVNGRARADAVPENREVPCSGLFNADEIPGQTVICGEVTVPVDRARPTGPTTTIPYTILKARSANPQPDPIIFIAGGPGGSATPNPVTTFAENYAPLRQDRDFILYDQRGTGFSRPSLTCEAWSALDLLTETLTPAEKATRRTDALFTCYDDYLAAGVDLAQYTTPVNAADLEDLLRALGYTQWNLFALSYGTMIAQQVMMEYPAGVRSVILDSAVPLHVNYWEHLAANRLQAFDTLFAACAADRVCSRMYPTLETDFYAAIDRFTANPIRVPQGDLPPVQLDGDFLADALFGALYAPSPQLPAALNQASNGEIIGFIRLIEINPNTDGQGIAWGVHHAINCAYMRESTVLDALIASVDPLPAALQAGSLADLIARYDRCAAWDVPAIPANERVLNVDVPIPALVLNGAFDPITPAAWGADIAATLPRARHYVVPTAGHGVIRGEACAGGIALAFIDDPAADLDASCITRLQLTFE